ncbi:hypothetical protein Slin15195_G130400 [Septoria linicola]|uniref:Uncharacterized protein n=1 Tax=Septoria linicola TaxID=215465 RepID=A0A9Q9B9W5_9PEZI|nr:hypothetical protein Slin15195_G130400 [Septoria linicola]
MKVGGSSLENIPIMLRGLSLEGLAPPSGGGLNRHAAAAVSTAARCNS